MDLDEEQENFFKVALIVIEVVPKRLRKFFVEKWNNKFQESTWESDNKSSGAAIIAKIKAANDYKKPKYKRELNTGDEHNWDTTVLMYVLLYSKLNLISGDEKDQLDELRKFRNDYFAHILEVACPSAKFAEKVGVIKGIAKAIFGEDAENDIDKILQSNITTERSRNLEQQWKEEKARNEKFEHLVSAMEEIKNDVKETKGIAKETNESANETKTIVKETKELMQETHKNVRLLKENNLASEITTVHVYPGASAMIGDHNITQILQPNNEKQQDTSKLRQRYIDLCKNHGFQRVEGNRIVNRMVEFNEFAVNVKMEVKESSSKIGGAEMNTPQCIEMRDLVDSKTRVTLLSGIAGMGKSVLAKRIVYSWAKEEMYKEFPMCLYFECRKLNEYILGVTDGSAKKDELQKFIKSSMPDWETPSHGDGVLVVIDGVDELIDLNQNHSIIYEFLDKSKSFINSKIIITGRPDTEHLCKTSGIDCGEYKIVEMKGLDSECQTTYIENFSKCMNQETPGEIKDLISKTISSSTNIDQLLSVPQFISTICCVSVLTKGKQVKSDAELYTWTLYLLLKHDYGKTIKKEGKIDGIFSKYRELVLLLGEVALHLYREKLIVFKKEDFNGFDSLQENHLSIFNGLCMEVPDEFCEKFEFKHLTLMQFLAAIYVCISSDFGELIKEISFDVVDYALGLFGECLCHDGESIIRSMFTALMDKNIEDAAKSFFLVAADLLRSSESNITRSIGLIRLLPKNIKDKNFVQRIFSNLTCADFCPVPYDLENIMELYRCLKRVGCDENETKTLFSNFNIHLLGIGQKELLEVIRYFKTIKWLQLSELSLTANDMEFIEKTVAKCETAIVINSTIEDVENTGEETPGWTLKELMLCECTLKEGCMNTIARWGTSSEEFMFEDCEYPQDWWKVFLAKARLRKEEGSLTLKKVKRGPCRENLLGGFDKEMKKLGVTVQEMDLDEEQENFFKVAIIVTEVVPKRLRNFFVEKWNIKFQESTWESDNKSNGAAIIAKIKAANDNKIPKYKGKLNTGNEHNWDITVLMYVLLYSNLNLVSDDEKTKLDQLRLFRNEYVAHVPRMACPSTKFAQRVDDIKVIAKAIFGEDAENDIDKILQSNSTTERSRNLEQQWHKEKARNEKFKQLVSAMEEIKNDGKETKEIAHETNIIVKDIRLRMENKLDNEKQQDTRISGRSDGSIGRGDTTSEERKPNSKEHDGDVDDLMVIED